MLASYFCAVPVLRRSRARETAPLLLAVSVLLHHFDTMASHQAQRRGSSPELKHARCGPHAPGSDEGRAAPWASSRAMADRILLAATKNAAVASKALASPPVGDGDPRMAGGGEVCDGARGTPSTLATRRLDRTEERIVRSRAPAFQCVARSVRQPLVPSRPGHSYPQGRASVPGLDAPARVHASEGPTARTFV